MAEKADELLSIREAREALGVSNHKIAALIAAGTLATQPDPLDMRRKLVKRSDVEALAARSKGKEAA